MHLASSDRLDRRVARGLDRVCFSTLAGTPADWKWAMGTHAPAASCVGGKPQPQNLHSRETALEPEAATDPILRAYRRVKPDSVRTRLR